MGQKNFLVLSFIFLLSACGGVKGTTGVSSGGGGSRDGNQNEKPLEGKPKNFDGFWRGSAPSLSGPVDVQLSISGFPESVIVKYQIQNNSVDVKGIFVGATINGNKILNIDGALMGAIGQAGFQIKDDLGTMTSRFVSNQQFEVTGELQNGRFTLNKAILRRIR